MGSKRNQLLEQKRQELEADLQRWATEFNLLLVSEQLTFELHITRVAPVVGRVLDKSTATVGKPPLPLDKEVPPGTRKTWRLNEEDWNKLAKVPLKRPEAGLLAMMRGHENGPLHRSEIAAQGLWEHGRVVLRLNAALEKHVGGGKYRVKQIALKSGYYAISKFVRCPSNHASES